MYRVLIVEDDADLSEIIAINLQTAGYQTDAAYCCAAAQTAIADIDYDLILLDILLPDARGESLCDTIRNASDAPIIFISCLDDSDTIIDALRQGGDDYMVKPLDFNILLARAEAILRRSGKAAQRSNAELLKCKEFSLDLKNRMVLRGEEKILLSAIEYRLLLYLIRNPDVLLTYTEIFENVWENDSFGDFRTLMVHVSNLRKKIDPDHHGIIETVRGAGYIFSNR